MSGLFANSIYLMLWQVTARGWQVRLWTVLKRLRYNVYSRTAMQHPAQNRTHEYLAWDFRRVLKCIPVDMHVRSDCRDMKFSIPCLSWVGWCTHCEPCMRSFSIDRGNPQSAKNIRCVINDPLEENWVINLAVKMETQCNSNVLQCLAHRLATNRNKYAFGNLRHCITLHEWEMTVKGYIDCASALAKRTKYLGKPVQTQEAALSMGIPNFSLQSLSRYVKMTEM